MLFTVLKVMHDVGWVYRNISINNLYEYRDGEVIIGKLGSLEYSKRTDDNSIHSARTVINPWFVCLILSILMDEI